MTGSGTATVTTPSAFEAGHSYSVNVGGSTRSITAAPDGSLTIVVPLGTANPVQEYFTPTNSAPATKVYSTNVTIQ